MKRQHVALLVAITLVALVTSGSTALVPSAPEVVATPISTNVPVPAPNATNGPIQGGIVKQWTNREPQSFDAHVASFHNIHNDKLYSGLVWNPDGDTLEPDTAASWEISADGTTWTFALRQNVLFHDGYTPAGPRDGTPMTAADVKYSLMKIMGLVDGIVSPRAGGMMREFIDISRPDNGVEVVDGNTVRVHLVQAFPALANALALGNSAIYPDGTTRDLAMTRPYGSGPFKLKSFQSGALWVYERNPDYFKPGLPYLDAIHLVVIMDTTVAQAAFLTGQIDLERRLPTAGNEPLYQQLVDQGDIVMRRYSTQCRPAGVFMNSTVPPFDDVRLRQAVHLAIDRQAYIDIVHNGDAITHAFLDTGGWGRSETDIWQLPGYRLPKDADLAQAQQLVLEAGYPDGLAVDMLVRNSTLYLTQGQFIANELAKIGINVTISAVDSPTFFNRLLAPDYVLFSYIPCQSTGTPEETFGLFFVTGGSRNWTGYSNSVVDSGYLDMAGTQDPTLRKQRALALEDILLADLPVAPLPVLDTSRNYWSYVQDVPVGMTRYMDEKLERIWRSDVAPPTPTPIPTVSWPGLGIMTGLLLAALLWAVRRRKRQPQESLR